MGEWTSDSDEILSILYQGYTVEMSSWDTSREQVYGRWKCRWMEMHPTEIGERTWNDLFTGGKEIRARLFCELWSYLSPHTSPPAALAFAWECVHVASLILDDTPWMDNAAVRRGRPTMHVLYSPKKAVLLAHDVMRMMVEIWEEYRPPFIVHETWFTHLQRILERLSIGQWYDLEKRGTLVELASLKTGVLFEGVTETVAMCLSLDTDAWAIWGNRMGVLFQWADDWEDQEEDRIQSNRNAFLEAYEDTLINYERVWMHLSSYIGSAWFDRPFGRWMRSYFTKEADETFPLFRVSYSQEDKQSIEPFVYCESVSVPSRLNGSMPLSVDGIGILRRILKIVMGMARKTPLDAFLQTDLWQIPEEKWDTVPEYRERIQQLEQLEETDPLSSYFTDVARRRL